MSMISGRVGRIARNYALEFRRSRRPRRRYGRSANAETRTCARRSDERWNATVEELNEKDRAATFGSSRRRLV